LRNVALHHLNTCIDALYFRYYKNDSLMYVLRLYNHAVPPTHLNISTIGSYDASSDMKEYIIVCTLIQEEPQDWRRGG
jgi:hypothetical protein